MCDWKVVVQMAIGDRCTYTIQSLNVQRIQAHSKCCNAPVL